MKKIIVLLCLGLLGCSTMGKGCKTPPQIVKAPVVVDKLEMENIISVFSEAINKTPDYAGAYYNRAMAYFYKDDYERCWQDVHMAESLGYKFSVDFLEALKKASGREK